MVGKRLAELAHEAHDQGRRLVAPLMGFPGVGLIDTNIKLAQQNYKEHFRAVRALTARFSPDMMFPLMDLSVEANALGRYTVFPEEDSATVPHPSFHFDELDLLKRIDISFDSRVMCYVETLKLMAVGLPESIMKGAYVTGPYSLCGLIMGADEASMAALANPDDLHKLCEVTTEKILEYSRLLISAGAQTICILEPTAVMLGPDQFKEFSADYVSHIIRSLKFSGVNVVYHICGNTMHLLENMAASGADGLSLDAKETGVDLAQAARIVPEGVVVIGNINPTSVMLQSRPIDVMREVSHLLTEMKPYPNFILSTGCDLPQETPAENIQAFMQAGRLAG